jgi:hypothetical protein
MGPPGRSQCDREHYARGLCRGCWKGARADGTISQHPRTKTAPGMSFHERIHNIWWTVSATGCWLWNGATNPAGYGQLAVG